MNHTFLRSERLKNETIIARMFKEGQSFACYPLRLVYLELPQNDPLSKNADFVENLVENTISQSEISQSPIPQFHNLAISNPQSPIQAAFSVPKKNFKLATDRNRLRRRVREAYRLHKHELYDYLNTHALNRNKAYAFMILYTAKEETEYVDIKKGVRKMIFRFKEAIEKKAPQ